MSRRIMTGRALSFIGLAMALIGGVSCGGTPVAPTPCTFAATLTRSSFDAAGGSAVVHVQTGATCAWSATSSAGWISLTPASGTGPGDVTLTVPTHEATEGRNATVTVATVSFGITQSGASAPPPCTFLLSPDSKTLGPEGGSDQVVVQTSAGCVWSAHTPDTWLALRTASGVGPGRIDYVVPPYDGSTQRQARLFVNEQSVLVRQDGRSVPCSYSVNPTSVGLHWHGAPGDGLNVSLGTDAGCTWTAASGASWIALLTPPVGQGPSTVSVQVGAFTADATRTAPLMLRWPTPTAGQNVTITQEGCRYAIGRRDETIPAAGVDRQQLLVFGDPRSVDCAIGCPWTVTIDVDWIKVLGALSRAGDDVIFYNVLPNPGPNERIGTMTVAGLTLTVHQTR